MLEAALPRCGGGFDGDAARKMPRKRETLSTCFVRDGLIGLGRSAVVNLDQVDSRCFSS